jgi:hypothetical protein
VEPIIISNAFTHSDTNSQMMASIETAAPVESLQLADEVSGNRSSAAEESQGSRTRPRNARLFEFFYAALFLAASLNRSIFCVGQVSLLQHYFSRFRVSQI